MKQAYEQFEKLEFSSNYVSRNPVIRFLLANFLRRLATVIHERREHLRKVLEIGSGEGYSTNAIKDWLTDGTSYVASDIIPELVKRTRALAGIPLVLSQDINHLAIRAKSFDMVIAMEVLEHLENPQTAILEVARATRRYAVISVPFEPWWRLGNVLRGAHVREWGNTPDHINHWGKRSFAEVLKLGFHSVKVKSSFPWLIAVCENPKNNTSAGADR
jgi:SAM-dependent methyltransferase